MEKNDKEAGTDAEKIALDDGMERKDLKKVEALKQGLQEASKEDVAANPEPTLIEKKEMAAAAPGLAATVKVKKPEEKVEEPAKEEPKEEEVVDDKGEKEKVEICHSLDTWPPELTENLLTFVPPKDLCNIVLSCKMLLAVASNPKLWTRMTVEQAKIAQDGLEILFSIGRFAKIRQIDLSYMTFTPDRLLANMEALASSSVEDLNLTNVNIAQVPSAKLAQVAGRLRKINLAGYHLTTAQKTAVLEACASSETLVDIVLDGNNLGEVPADLVARAASNLQTMVLGATSLTTAQCIAVLEACASSQTLLNIDLAGNNLGEVPADLLARAASNVQVMNLEVTYLTTAQCIAVLEESISSKTLVNIFLYGNNLGEVTGELLARAMETGRIRI